MHDAYAGSELTARRRRRALEAVADGCGDRDDVARTRRAGRVAVGALERRQCIEIDVLRLCIVLGQVDLP